jgi:crotonobetainyl-CoA:carnitine CoA-transferase CaiB-like acyl-CoA transferase
VAHDLNVMAASGLLSLLPPSQDGVLPQVQMADVTTGILAATAILAALLQRQATHEGLHIDQPLTTGPLPFVTWPAADCAAGSPGWPQAILSGGVPGYARYFCADGLELVVGAVEPKFWRSFVEALDLPQWAAAGLAVGPDGLHVKAEVARRLAQRPRAYWLSLFAPLNLPVSPLHTLAEAGADPDFYAPGGHRALNRWFPSWKMAREPREVTPCGSDQQLILRALGAEDV